MSRHRISIGTFLIVALLSMAMVMAGCSGNGSSGNVAGDTSQKVSFNVKGASQLIALSNTVAPASTTSTAQKLWSRVTGLKSDTFKYKIVNQGLSNDEVVARAKGVATVSVSQQASTPVAKGTNLLAIDASGNAGLAIDTNSLVKVMYSVTDPMGEYVYLALDTGFIKPDGNDYTQFIASNNCAFYRVKIADNTYSCVKEGVYVQPIDEAYQQRVSSNEKPIQFDQNGNMYFPATAFNATCDENGFCKMAAADWKPRIYRAAADTWAVTALTQDNQVISYYLTMPTGELAFQTISQDGSISLYLWQPSLSTYNVNGTTTNLTGNSVAIDFFTVDNYNTVMWGGWSESAIRFARPGSGGVVQKATLDTSILSPRNNYSGAYAPRRISVGDDGKLYALFSHLTGERQQDNTYKYFNYNRIYQVLPYSAVVKAETKIEVNPNAGWNWNLIGSQTPFQVGGGYLFYKESREKLGYGVYDVIQMVSLKNRSLTTLLGGTNDTWEIYSWRLKGDRLFFAALDLSSTTVYSGEIDIAYVKSNPLANPDLFVFKRAVASAVGASSKVQDIEGLRPLPVFAGATTPVVNKIHSNSENIYSLSIEFSNLMNKGSAENNINVTQVDSGGNYVSDVATMKLWIANFLHLIPDLDVNNATIPPRPDDALLDLKHTTPMSFDTFYKIAVDKAGVDATGATVLTTSITGSQLASNYTSTLHTRPQFGWYTASDTSGLSNYVGKYAGGDTSSNYYEHWALNSALSGTSVPANFRLEFVGTNSGSQGLYAILYDDSDDPNYTYSLWSNSYPNSGAFMTMSISPWGRSYWMSGDQVNMLTHNLSYYDCSTGTCVYSYLYARDPLIFNGETKRYRLDVFGNQVRLYKENPPSSGIFELAKFEYYDNVQNMWVEDSQSWNTFKILPRVAGHKYKLFMKTFADSPLSIDNLTVTQLDSSGNVMGNAFQTVDFESGIVPSGAKNSNVPDLVNSVKSNSGTAYCDTLHCAGMFDNY